MLNVLTDNSINWDLNGSFSGKFESKNNIANLIDLINSTDSTGTLTIKAPKKEKGSYQFEMLLTEEIQITTQSITNDETTYSTETGLAEFYLCLKVNNTDELKFEILMDENFNNIDYNKLFNNPSSFSFLAYTPSTQVICYNQKDPDKNTQIKQQIASLYNNGMATQIKTTTTDITKHLVNYSILNNEIQPALCAMALAAIDNLINGDGNNVAMITYSPPIENGSSPLFDEDIDNVKLWILSLQFKDNISLFAYPNNTYKTIGTKDKFLFKYEGDNIANLRLKLYYETDTQQLKPNSDSTLITSYNYVTRYVYTELTNFNLKNYNITGFTVRNVNWTEGTWYNATESSSWADVDNARSTTWRDDLTKDKVIDAQGTIYTFNVNTGEKLTITENQDITDWGINEFRKSTSVTTLEIENQSSSGDTPTPETDALEEIFNTEATIDYEPENQDYENSIISNDEISNLLTTILNGTTFEERAGVKISKDFKLFNAARITIKNYSVSDEKTYTVNGIVSADEVGEVLDKMSDAIPDGQEGGDEAYYYDGKLYTKLYSESGQPQKKYAEASFGNYLERKQLGEISDRIQYVIDNINQYTVKQAEIENPDENIMVKFYKIHKSTDVSDYVLIGVDYQNKLRSVRISYKLSNGDTLTATACPCTDWFEVPDFSDFEPWQADE